MKEEKEKAKGDAYYVCFIFKSITFTILIKKWIRATIRSSMRAEGGGREGRKEGGAEVG
jgi:hypothetical protein